MKKFAIIVLCLFLLSSCSNTDVNVTPEQVPDSPQQSTSSSITPDTDKKQEVLPSNEEKTPPPQPQNQSVSIVVHGLGGEVMFSGETEFYDEMTALDILLDTAEEKNIEVVYSGNKSSAYIKSIDGLAEKQHGGMSGWVYTVNGESIMKPAGKCILNPGDSVEWKYMEF